MSAATALRWKRPVRLGTDLPSDECQRQHKMLAHSLVHASHDGRVLLEAGAPMSDGSTAYLVWLRIDDAQVGGLEDADDPYSTQWFDGPHAHGPLGRYDGRWYAHKYDEGGLASAKWSAEQVAHEAAE